MFGPQFNLYNYELCKKKLFMSKRSFRLEKHLNTLINLLIFKMISLLKVFYSEGRVL